MREAVTALSWLLLLCNDQLTNEQSVSVIYESFPLI